MGAIMHAAIEHRATDGAEAEIQAHFKVAANQIPLEMLRVEQRAITTAPTNTQSESSHEIVPPVFPASVAEFLSIYRPNRASG